MNNTFEWGESPLGYAKKKKKYWIRKTGTLKVTLVTAGNLPVIVLPLGVVEPINASFGEADFLL